MNLNFDQQLILGLLHDFQLYNCSNLPIYNPFQEDLYIEFRPRPCKNGVERKWSKEWEQLSHKLEWWRMHGNEQAGMVCMRKRVRVYLCCTVIPIIEQSTNEGKTGEGINSWGQ